MRLLIAFTLLLLLVSCTTVTATRSTVYDHGEIQSSQVEVSYRYLLNDKDSRMSIVRLDDGSYEVEFDASSSSDPAIEAMRLGFEYGKTAATGGMVP